MNKNEVEKYLARKAQESARKIIAKECKTGKIILIGK